jgi:hypothetical protein
MGLKLEPHPTATTPAIGVEAEAERVGAELLRLSYVVTGDLDAVEIPPPAAPERADGLWKHTCFEAFVRPAADAGYWEFNFAPSGKWAAYRFSDYRAGMVEVDVPAPTIDVRRDEGRLEVAVELDLGPELGLLAHLDWQLGLSAVIETKQGEISHWALSHPPGTPDFHHQDCFALELPAAKRE